MDIIDEQKRRYNPCPGGICKHLKKNQMNTRLQCRRGKAAITMEAYYRWRRGEGEREDRRRRSNIHFLEIAKPSKSLPLSLKEPSLKDKKGIRT
jgi:hypothetical protein